MPTAIFIKHYAGMHFYFSDVPAASNVRGRGSDVNQGMKRQGPSHRPGK